MDEAFDYSFVSYRDCADIWESLIPEICDLADRTKGKEEPEARRMIASSSIPQRIATHITAFGELVENQNQNHLKRWRRFSEQYRRKQAYDKRFASSVKSALIPLAWLPSGDLERIISGKTVKKHDQLEAFVRLGGGVAATAGIRGNADILELQYFFDKKIVTKTIQGMQSSEGIHPLIDSLGSAERLSSRIIRTAKAVQAKTLENLCEDAQNKADIDYTGRCWPFEICTAWVKLKKDNKFGLLEAQREAIGDTRTDYSWDPIIYYTEGQFDKLSAEQVRDICGYLEEKLNDVKPVTPSELSDSLLTEAHKEKKYNPLHWIVRETLEFYQIPYNKKYTFQCLFAEKAGLQRSSGRTTYQLFVNTGGKRTIIHTLSAYSSTHKDVEFAAKARLCHHREIDGAIQRKKDIRIVYVLDGTHWPARTVYMLERAGAEVVLITEFSKWVEKNRDSLI